MNETYQKLFSGKKNAGFTLIELLVVVLIIGILSAVALPQYQKAVIKSRVATAVASLKTIQQAEDACALAKGEGCLFDELDVSVPAVKPLNSEYAVGGFAVVPMIHDGHSSFLVLVQWGFGPGWEGMVAIGSGPDGLFCGQKYGDCSRLGFSRTYSPSWRFEGDVIDGELSRGPDFNYYQ